jgi:hypothetical protein
LVALLCWAPGAHAAVPVPFPGMVHADSSIDGLTRVGNRIVLTGTFHHVGPYVGSGVALDPDSGARDAAFARFDGQVSDAIEDGNGGLYVAGQFLAGGQRRAVAHVLASGAFDPKFNATLDGFADALALHDGRLYVGRWFQKESIVALDAATGTVDSGFDAPTAGTEYPNAVTELLAVGSRLYAGTLDGLLVVDLGTGKRDAGFDCSVCGDRVMSLATSGDRLYVGLRRAGIHAVSLTTGAADAAFAPSPNRASGNATPEDLGPMVLLVQGSRLIVGGRGMHLGGPSSTLAALDLDTGAADSGFGRGFSNPVHDLVQRGTSLLLAGAPRPGRPAPVLKVDAATGRFESALAPMLDGQIDALAPAGDDRLFVGGRFATANAIRTDGVAEVDARTGALIPGFSVRGLPTNTYVGPPVLAGDSLIFGWDYFTGGGLATDAMAFSARNGVRRRAFAPRSIHFPQAGAAASSVWAATPGRVYVAHPTHDNGTMWARSGVDVFSSTTGRRIARYDLPYPGYVQGIEPHGSQLFLAGSFRRRWPDGRPRNLATMSVKPLTGAINEQFDAHTNGPVSSIFDVYDRLFLSGGYNIAYGRQRPGFASVYDNTGAINGGFNRRVSYAFGVGSGLIGAYQLTDRLIGVSAITGKSLFTLPAVTPGFRGTNFVLAPGGAYTTYSVDLPWYADSGTYDSFAGFLPVDWIAGRR